MESQLDMSAIQAALQRRMDGAMPQPAVSQMTSPMGALPTGGPNTPVTPPPTPMSPPMAPAAAPSTANGIMKGASATQGPAFDDETKMISKALIKKLLEAV